VIRTVALGVVCLAGLGALAAAAKRPPLLQPAEVVFPIVAGSKADRLTPYTSSAHVKWGGEGGPRFRFSG
jgi:hypothetical protein